MKDKIIKVLKTHPNGLMAKEISAYIPNTDRRMINQVLYSNRDCFQISADYVWTLKTHTLTDKEKKFADSLVAQIIAEIKKTAPKPQKKQILPSKTTTPTNKKKDVSTTKRNVDYIADQWYIQYQKEQKEKEEKRQKARAKIAEINKQQRENDSHIDFDQQQQIQRLEERRREQSLKERTQRENEEKSQKERYKHRYSIEDYNANYELFRKCTGDCSTCTREDCIEK